MTSRHVAMQDPFVDDSDGKKIIELVLLIISLVVILCLYQVCSHTPNVAHPIRIENITMESEEQRAENQPERVPSEQTNIV